MSDIAAEIAKSDQGVAQDVVNMSSYMHDVMYAVGSLDANGQRSDFSNYGCWVNAAAFGRDVFGEYPTGAYGANPSTTTTLADGSLGTYAQWSGTSFATANFTAALAANAVGTQNGAQILTDGLGAVGIGQPGDCAQTVPTTTA
jgi:hypothetical protein